MPSFSQKLRIEETSEAGQPGQAATEGGSVDTTEHVSKQDGTEGAAPHKVAKGAALEVGMHCLMFCSIVVMVALHVVCSGGQHGVCCTDWFYGNGGDGWCYSSGRQI